MQPRTFIVPLAALVVALSGPALKVAAESEAALPLDLAPRVHDDWMLPSNVPSLDLSPRSHDDWAVSP